MIFVDSCSDQEVIAGQGTIGLEILEQNPDIDTILVPICEALISGIGEIPFHMAQQCIDEILIVEERLIRKATALLMTKE